MGIRLGNTARSTGIGRRVRSNSLQTAVALARLQQRAVPRERLVQEDHALQRGLDACLAQLVDASLDRRVHSEHGNENTDDGADGRQDVNHDLPGGGDCPCGGGGGALRTYLRRGAGQAGGHRRLACRGYENPLRHAE